MERFEKEERKRTGLKGGMSKAQYPGRIGVMSILGKTGARQLLHTTKDVWTLAPMAKTGMTTHLFMSEWLTKNGVY